MKSIQAYKDLHFKDDNTDYSKSLSFNEILEFLFSKGISGNYNTPMDMQSIKRMGESRCRQVYNNIVATHNLVNIKQTTGGDLGITDCNKYDYLLTYSFP